MALSPSLLAGQLIVGGYEGEAPSPRFLRALGQGHRGGAILFKRNLPSLEAAFESCRALLSASSSEVAPPFLGIDQEGGRVVRLPPPALRLPPMRTLGRAGDLELASRAARIVAAELRSLGFNVNFAPVLDVDTNPANPVIGDRSFGDRPEVVAQFGVAVARGLQESGVLACGKHFPGHGDTHLDSHLALPSLEHPRERLDRVELPPFRAAIEAGIGSLMTAHIVCEALDPGVPSTLSRKIATDLLRGELGFRGVLFSDDLEMKAIADSYSYEDAAVQAIEAGCDVLLVCRDEDAQDRIFEALARRIEQNPRFRERAEEAVSRSFEERRAFSPSPAASMEEMKAVFQRTDGAALLSAIERAIG